MTSPAISHAKPSSPVINFASAATAPSAGTAELADHPDALDPLFGKVPAGFELKNQPMPMLVYWLKKARARIDEITQGAETAGAYSEAEMASAMDCFNEIFDVIVSAESNLASDVASQMQAVVNYLDCLKSDSIEEAIDLPQFQNIAGNLKRATAFRQPRKRLGNATKGRRLTRTGLLQRYQSFLMQELFTLSTELYGDPQYALQCVSFDDAVQTALKSEKSKRGYVFLDPISLTSRARTVLKSLKVDTENVER
jgi:hypothetical protein